MKAPTLWISVDIRLSELHIVLEGLFRDIIIILRLSVVISSPVLGTLLAIETGRYIRKFWKGII